MENIEYSKIIKRSWSLTWKNKWLWVLGLVMATFGSGGTGGGFSSSSLDSSPSEPTMPIEVPSNMEDQTSYVLGVASDYFEKWFSSVAAINWVILAVAFLAIMFISIVAHWVIANWAKGALISGFEHVDNDKVVTLKSISPYGLANIKKLIIFNLISFLVTLILIVGFLVIIGVGFILPALFETAGIVLLVLLGVLALLVFLVLMVMLTMVSIYAERLIVLKSYSPWEAWKKGFSLSKGNFFPTIVMGIINSIIGFTVGCLGVIVSLIIFSVPGFLLIAPLFNNGFTMPSVPQIIGIFILFLLFFSLNIAVKAVFIVFNYGNWNLFFKQVFTEKKEIKNE